MSKYKPKSKYLQNIPKMNGVWCVDVAKRDKVQIREKHISEEQVTGVWCPILPSTYFVARRNDTVYITGNTPIQGTAADIINFALIRSWQRKLREFPRARFLLQIHDELIWEVPQEDLPAFDALLQEEMEREVEIGGLPRQFRTTRATGYSLGKLEEEKQ